MWSRDSPAWLWAALLALFLVALVAGAIAAVAATKDDEKGLLVVSTGVGTTATVGTIDPGTQTTGPTASVETITGPTTQTIATLDTSTLTTSTTVTTTPTGSIRSWPAGKEGYTVVLASVETSKGRAAAEKQANQAIANGLTNVGILTSSDFISLNPGYNVVFMGVYNTAAAAESGLPTARSRGFPLAYVREVTP